MREILYKGKFLVIKDGKKLILAVGDLHLGFESALNHAGVFVNRYIFDEIKKDFDEIFMHYKKFDEIVLLGDIKHTFGSILREERLQLAKILEIMTEKADKIIITKGNHDVLIDYLVKNERVEIKDMHLVDKCAFLHGDRDFELLKNKEVDTIIIGHMHPAVVLREGAKSEKYKCFLEGSYKSKKFIIVPSLVSNNEGTDPRDFPTKLPWDLPIQNFKVIAVGEKIENFEFGKLKEI